MMPPQCCGLHDAANSIATIVSTRVLHPRAAVVWASFFNFIAFLFFGLHVAQTLGTGIVDPAVVTPRVIFAALTAAIVWNLVTWWAAIPSSSSHALIGGLIGAGLASGGLGAIVWWGVLKTVVAIVLSPAVGFALALLLVLGVSWTFLGNTPFAVDRTFRRLQFVSAALYSLGQAATTPKKPWASLPACCSLRGIWVRPSMCPCGWSSCQAAMALGTLFGGWRIVRPWGRRLPASRRCRDFARKPAARSRCCRQLARHSRVHHAHHHRGHSRCWRRTTGVGGPLERRQRRGHGVAAHASGRRPNFRPRLCGHGGLCLRRAELRRQAALGRRPQATDNSTLIG